MNEQDIEKLRSISNSLQRLNSKVKLLALLEKAKKEFDSHNYSDCEKYCNEILKKDSKNSIALRGLGCVMFISGNSKKALEYYKMGADSGNVEAYNYLGEYYRNNNDAESYKYHKLAADKGVLSSQRWIAHYSVHGIGCKKNLNDAFRYYKLAADQNHDESQYQVGVYLEEGTCGVKDKKQAIEYYKKAARNGHEEAKKKLRKMLIFKY